MRRHGRIRPNGFHRTIFLSAGEEVRHVGKKPVHFVRRVDYYLRVRHGEGDFYLALVANGADEGVQATLNVGGVPVRDGALECESGVSEQNCE